MYVETDIPPGMTIDEYRAARARDSAARLVAEAGGRAHALRAGRTGSPRHAWRQRGVLQGRPVTPGPDLRFWLWSFRSLRHTLIRCDCSSESRSMTLERSSVC